MPQLDDDPDESDLAPDLANEPTLCPHCRKPIYDDAEQCPHCRQYISEEDTPQHYPLWLIFGLIAAGAAIALWILTG